MAKATFNPGEFEEILRREMAKKLLKCGAVFIAIMQGKLSVSFPPPSRVGEFPHWRTGTGRSAVTYLPADLATAAQTLRVRVGLRKAGEHLADLEIKRGRRGFLDVFDEYRSKFEAILS